MRVLIIDPHFACYMWKISNDTTLDSMRWILQYFALWYQSLCYRYFWCMRIDRFAFWKNRIGWRWRVGLLRGSMIGWGCNHRVFVGHFFVFGIMCRCIWGNMFVIRIHIVLPIRLLIILVVCICIDRRFYSVVAWFRSFIWSLFWLRGFGRKSVILIKIPWIFRHLFGGWRWVRWLFGWHVGGFLKKGRKRI